MSIMLTQYFWLVTMLAFRNGPLNGWVISIEKVLNVGYNLWTIKRNTHLKILKKGSISVERVDSQAGTISSNRSDIAITV